MIFEEASNEIIFYTLTYIFESFSHKFLVIFKSFIKSQNKINFFA